MKAEKPYCLPVILLILMTTCDNPVDPVTGEDLQNVVWRLDSLQTPAGKDAPTPARHTSIHFTEDMEIRVDQSCRDYDGSYELGAGQSLSISPLDSTDDFCHWGEWVTDFEDIFADALRKIESYNTDGDRLTLHSSQNDYVLDFSLEIRDSSLANILWKLDTLQTATDTFVPNPEVHYSYRITTAFYDSWVVAGASSCTYYYADYDLGENEFLDVQYVSRFLEIPCKGNELQMEVLRQALYSIDSYSRDGQRLTLYNQERTTRLSYSIGAVDEALTKTLFPIDFWYNFETERDWRFDSLQTPEGSIMPDAGTNIQIIFLKELAAWIGGICNDYRGYAGSFLNLEPGALTFDMGAGYQGSGVCSKMDSTFMTALDKIGYYDMTGDNLTLRDSQDGYVLYFTDK